MAKHRKNRDEEETSYWLSYSDMMAALLLTFVLIIAFTMLQSKKQYDKAKTTHYKRQAKKTKRMMQKDKRHAERMRRRQRSNPFFSS